MSMNSLGGREAERALPMSSLGDERPLVTWARFDYPVPPLSEPRELDYYDSDVDTWTPEQKDRYLDQVRRTQGFEVDHFPFTGVVVIKPLDINDKELATHLQSCAQMAIKAYNHGYKDRKGGELQFVKVVKCMKQFFLYRRYFLTFEARDLLNNQVRTYQTVLFRAPKIKLHVQSFRLELPTCDGEEEGGAGDCQENWFWRGHHFDPYPYRDDDFR